MSFFRSLPKSLEVADSWGDAGGQFVFGTSKWTNAKGEEKSGLSLFVQLPGESGYEVMNPERWLALCKMAPAIERAVKKSSGLATTAERMSAAQSVIRVAATLGFTDRATVKRSLEAKGLADVADKAMEAAGVQ